MGIGYTPDFRNKGLSFVFTYTLDVWKIILFADAWGFAEVYVASCVGYTYTRRHLYAGPCCNIHYLILPSWSICKKIKIILLEVYLDLNGLTWCPDTTTEMKRKIVVFRVMPKVLLPRSMNQNRAYCSPSLTILMRLRHQYKDIYLMTEQINENKIEIYGSQKFLGIILQENLSDDIIFSK